MRVTAARSFLFVPGDSERRLDKAVASAADVVIADLEDAVAAGAKDTARALVAALARKVAGARALTVRVNTAPGLLEADLAALEGLAFDALVMPKASTALLDRLSPDGPPAVAIVETAAGLQDAGAIATHPRCGRLLLGSVDLAAELGLDLTSTATDPLLAPRTTLVTASAAAGIAPPVDGVHTAVGDIAGLRRQAERARALGLTAKACIHPGQLDTVHEVLTPDADELARAQGILDAYAAAERDATGAFVLDGQMVDIAVVKRAQRVLASGGGR